jgi:hypothetical protein
MNNKKTCAKSFDDFHGEITCTAKKKQPGIPQMMGKSLKQKEKISSLPLPPETTY